MEEQEQEEHVEEEEEKQVLESSRLWGPIHSPHFLRHRHLPSPLQTHHRSLSDSQTQFKSCSISPIKDDNRSIVFPPINHEGLHLSSPTPSPCLSKHHDSSDNPQENGFLWVPQPQSGTGSEGGGEVARWVGIGFELLRSRVTSIASSLRNLAGVGGVNWSFCSAARVAVAVLLWWLYAVVRRRKRRDSRVKRESRDQLLRIVKEKDEASKTNEPALPRNEDIYHGPIFLGVIFGINTYPTFQLPTFVSTDHNY